MFEITITKSIQNQKLKGTIQNKRRANTDLSLDFFVYTLFQVVVGLLFEILTILY